VLRSRTRKLLHAAKSASCRPALPWRRRLPPPGHLRRLRLELEAICFRQVRPLPRRRLELDPEILARLVAHPLMRERGQQLAGDLATLLGQPR
jgi:hypothetical protein